MNDYQTLEKGIVRELSCRLCLCSDVIKLKPLSAEVKRKIKRLFDITVRADDNLPKAICHECLQQISHLHLYSVKVEKTQKFLEFHKLKSQEEKSDVPPSEVKPHPVLAAITPQITSVTPKEDIVKSKEIHSASKARTPPVAPSEQGDSKLPRNTDLVNKVPKKRHASDLKYMEAMSLDEFASCEKVDKSLLHGNRPIAIPESKEPRKEKIKMQVEPVDDTLDPIVLIDGRPAKQGAALDRQISLFYKMECCICHDSGFHFRSLMKHYKERHGVPGYVTCCEKKYHYFYPKKIIEHMAYHLQPNIFMCRSCHQNFQTSQELIEHESNGGRSEGKITCPRCSERYPTYHELGYHIVSHRSEKLQCDYCGKLLKHHHRKKTINRMEDLILCTQCIRTLKTLEKHEKEIKEKIKVKSSDTLTPLKYQRFNQAMGLSCEEDASTE